MSLDRRLRDGLDRLAEEIDTDVEGRLSATLERGQRPRLVTFAPLLGAAVAGILLVVVVGPAAISLLRGEVGAPGDPTPPPSPSAPSLVGAYATTVGPGDPAVDEHNLAGQWTIAFEATGVLTVSAPTEFAGTRTGYSYQVTDDRLVTDLFGSDVCSTLLPGSYRWELVGETLAFTAIEEPCAGRAALLSGQAWQGVAGE